MKLTAVIFDMDGTMLDSEPMHRVVKLRAAADCGIEFSEEQYAHFYGRPKEHVVPFLQQWFGPDFSVEHFWNRCRVHYEAVFNRPIEHKPGLVPLLDYLTALNIPLAVATSTDSRRAQLHLRAAGIRDRFAAVVGGEETKKGKPDPDIFLLAAERLGAAPSQCVVIEDSEAGILAAHRAGMRVIAVPDMVQPAPDIARLAEHVVPTLSDVIPLLQNDLAGTARINP